MQKYYDVLRFRSIMDIYSINIVEAMKRFDAYFEEYPEDYSSYPYYINLLITIGKFKKAEELMGKIESLAKISSTFHVDDEKMKHFKYKMAMCRARILVFENRYKEALDFCRDCGADPDLRDAADDLGAIIFYCRNKLGFMRKEIRPDIKSYLFRQVLVYNEADLLDHIKKHLYSEEEQEDVNTCFFVQGFPIQEVLKEVKKRISGKNTLYQEFISTTHYFKFDGCGRVDNKIVNYFKVVAIVGTSDLITIYPCREGEYLPHDDLSHLKKEDDVKVERPSQIDKFRRRYGM